MSRDEALRRGPPRRQGLLPKKREPVILSGARGTRAERRTCFFSQKRTRACHPERRQARRACPERNEGTCFFLKKCTRAERRACPERSEDLPELRSSMAKQRPE